MAASGPLLVISDSAEMTAARLGLKSYGRTATHLLLEETAPALNLSPVVVSPGSRMPLYVVSLPAGRHIAALDSIPALFRDGDEVLVQMDETTAARVARAGGELVRLPDKPHPVHATGARDFRAPATPDTFIQHIIARVSPDSIHTRMARLEAFRTRYSPTDSCRAAERYVYGYLASLGLDSVELEPYVQGDTWHNVIGTKLGRTRPDKVLIVCGHMDAISEDPWNLAPGMEDNGSGSCLAMEAARVLAGENLDYTVKFIAFTGEEEGLYGSDHYARQARQRGEDIICAFNFDMVAWPGGDWGVALVGVSAAASLVRYEGAITSLYTSLAYRVSFRSFPSDSRSFDNYAYPATSGYEYGSQPYIWYHTTADTLGNCSMPLAAEVTKMAVATLASLGLAPLAPEGLHLVDAGTGTTLVASWQASAEPDLAGYKLVWGTASRNYTDSALLGRVTTRRIEGLETGTRYYAAVVALDSAGHESGASAEDSAIPGTVPLPPRGLAALPFLHGMALSWLRNSELDLRGYNLYRRTAAAGYVRINSSLLSDTTYRDSSLLPDTMYYYVATAVDSGANESDSSLAARGKPMTLDHGILLVDETRNGTGQPGNPSDAQQDAFYHAALRGYTFTDWDVATDSVPLAGDVGPYSTIVWHADDYSQQEIRPALPGLANYLALGGRLWLVGWKPVVALMGSGTYPFTFSAGQFPFDYLHLAAAQQSVLRDFIGASGLAGYPGVTVDSAKATPSLHGRLPCVDALLPRDAETVLTFNSFSGDTFQGKPVGVRWLAEPGRIVFFGFPFYYMKEDEARLVALKVLDDLGEPYGIAEGRLTPGARRLTLDVEPNPAARSFHVSYNLPAAAQAKLALYDVTGKMVKALVNARQPKGSYLLRFDARGLAAGTYVCRLTAGGATLSRKLALSR